MFIATNYKFSLSEHNQLIILKTLPFFISYNYPINTTHEYIKIIGNQSLKEHKNINTNT